MSKKIANVNLSTLKSIAKESAITSLLGVLFPPAALARLIYKAVIEAGKITNDDAQNVESIIKAGRQNMVDEMNITIDREQMSGVRAKLEEMDVDFEVGTKGKTKYIINVKYKK